MDAKTYSRRLLSPFHGMLQVVEVPGGVAESADGLSWKLYVADEAIVSHTGLSEIQYGSWSLRDGRVRSRVRGTYRSGLIEETGERLIAALETWADQVPFTALDRQELWLLDADRRMPLALLETAMEPAARGPIDAPRWLPGSAAKTDFVSSYGDASTLVDLFSRTAGKRARAVWLERAPTGDGRLDSGAPIPAPCFPELFLRTAWGAAEEAGLVRDFLAWQAPWLLQLPDLDRESRTWLERAAWRRPSVTSRVFRLYPDVLDPEGLQVARVKARLMEDPVVIVQPSEPFYPFYIE